MKQVIDAHKKQQSSSRGWGVWHGAGSIIQCLASQEVETRGAATLPSSLTSAILAVARCLTFGSSCDGHILMHGT